MKIQNAMKSDFLKDLHEKADEAVPEKVWRQFVEPLLLYEKGEQAQNSEYKVYVNCPHGHTHITDDKAGFVAILLEVHV